MVPSDRPFDVDGFERRVRKALKAEARAVLLGRPPHFHSEVGSTNDVALDLAGEGAPEGTLVLAVAQARGRGRTGRTWVSAPGGGLWFSVVLRPGLGYPASGMLPVAVGFAVVLGLREVGLGTACLKWPNDVVCRPRAAAGAPWRKIAGVLVEGRSAAGILETVIAGVGVNWATPILDQPFYPVTGLAAEIDPPAPEVVLAKLLDQIEKAYLLLKIAGPAPFVATWPSVSAHFARPVTVRPFAASAADEVLAGALLPDGALEARTFDGGRLCLRAAEVSVGPPPGTNHRAPA